MTTPRFAILVFLCCQPITTRALETPPTTRELELQYTAPKGNIVQIESSTDLKHWSRSSEIYFGSGSARSYRIQADGAADHGYYRFATQTEPVVGTAPWHLQPATWSTYSQTAGDHGNVLIMANGQCRLSLETTQQPAATTFDFTRTGLNTAELQTPVQGKLSVTWFNPSLGFYTLTRQNGEARRGAFSASSLPQIPVSYQTHCFAFSSSLQTQYLRPSTSGCVLTKADQEITPPTITYSLTGNVATMVVVFDPENQDNYTLTYTSPTGGAFTREEIRQGLPEETVTGSFALN
jgi:hypothetical protein